MARVKQQASKLGAEPIQVVRYLRVSRLMSRKLDDEAFHSPELQLAAIDAEFDKQFGSDGWRLADIEGTFGTATFADFDVSGTSMDRRGLDAALRAAGATGASALGVYNLSRWARNVLGALRRADELEESGCSLISAKERTDFVSPEGRFTTTLFLALAEMFAGQRGEEWSQVIEQRAQAGHHHGNCPVGYRRPLDETGARTGDLVVDVEAADDVVEAFTRCRDGASLNAVGRWLRDRRRISSPTQVRGILANRAYRRSHAPECDATCARSDPHGDRGEVRSWDLEKVTRHKRRRANSSHWYPAKHEGIVEADLFDAVARRLAERDAEVAATGRRERERSVVVHELVGVVRCSQCLRALAADASKLRKAGSPITLRDNSGRDIGCPGPGTVTANRVLDVVLAELRDIANAVDPEAVREAIQERDRPRQSAVDAEVLSKRRSRALAKITEVQASVALGDYPGSNEEAERLIQRLRKEVADADVALREATEPTGGPAAAPASARDLFERWEAMSVEQRNGALRQLVEVFVGPRSEGAPWRQPYAERLSLRWAWEA